MKKKADDLKKKADELKNIKNMAFDMKN